MIDGSNLIAFNSYGGFSKDYNEYHILNNNTPLPWCNVLANENFGTIISSYGTVYSFFKNSREYKITEWSNDWTNMEEGESFKGIFENDYKLVYGFGYVKINEENDDIIKSMDIFVPYKDNLKVQYIKIKNNGLENKEINISYSLKPVLGVTYEVDSQNVISRKIDDNTYIMKNLYSKDFSDVISYVKVYCYNKKCNVNIDENNFRVDVNMNIPSNSELCFAIILGAYENIDNFNEYFDKIDLKYGNEENLIKEYKSTKRIWKNNVKRNIDTGDINLNIMANGWLLYQTIVCRLYARSAFYQSGGAIGFRDQLQDTLALISHLPNKTRNQIILHSSKQFEKGDVLHWWHPHNNAGIRTYFSDDYLWLPYVLCEYINKTLDYSILNVETNYLEDKSMGTNRELYEIFHNIDKKDSVYNHAKKSIMYGLSRINDKNGLLDIGDGDWNDGFSNIRGQSVWLTFFMMDILKKFESVSDYMKDEEMSKICKKYRHIFKNNIINSAYEKKHFVRAYFENGDVLGSFKNNECKIDLISQAFAAIALKDYPDMHDEIINSLEMADEYLVDHKNMIVRLLYPPFDKPKNNPGYIKAYIPGTRENGGQYTHAATWLAKAYFEMNMDDKGLQILKYLCPINHSDTKEKADIYMVEPYVMAADVYSNSEHVGRGGWTWYTGSSAWMYKVMEDKYGEIENNKIKD